MRSASLVLGMIAVAIIPLTFFLNFLPPFSSMHGGPGAMLLTAPLLCGIVFVSLMMFLAALVRKFGARTAVFALLPAIVASGALLFFAAWLPAWF